MKHTATTFQQIVESAPNAMILVSSRGEIILVNKQTEQLFGFDRQELIGQRVEVLIPERFRTNHETYRNRYLSHPSTRAMGAGRELFGLAKNGKEVPIEIGLNTIDTDEGQMVLTSIIDVTERQELQQFKELHIRNKELEQFNYVASHDMQEPLRTVANYIQAIEEDFGDTLTVGAKAYLNTIKKANNRMIVLVRSLLDFSQIGRSKTITMVDTNRVVREVLDSLDEVIKPRHAIITVGHLPKIRGFEAEVHQLFLNLISNALKFHRKEERLKITISATKKLGIWEFAVADNGIGIAAEHYERIFQIFQKLHPLEYEGSGVGLAVVKKIVEIHQGHIRIQSTIGEGTTFFFTLNQER